MVAAVLRDALVAVQQTTLTRWQIGPQRTSTIPGLINVRAPLAIIVEASSRRAGARPELRERFRDLLRIEPFEHGVGCEFVDEDDDVRAVGSCARHDQCVVAQECDMGSDPLA